MIHIKWALVGWLILAIFSLLALGFAAMSTNPLFVVPAWVPCLFFTLAGLVFLGLIAYLLQIWYKGKKAKLLSITVLSAYQSDKPLKKEVINVDVEFRVKSTKLPIRISKIEFWMFGTFGTKFINANSPSVPISQVIEIESYVANFDLDYYQYWYSVRPNSKAKYWLCVLTAGSKWIAPIFNIGDPQTILMNNKPDGFNLVFKKKEIE